MRLPSPPAASDNNRRRPQASIGITPVVAFMVSAVVAVRFYLPYDVASGTVVAAALLPVTWSVLRRFEHLWIIVALGTVAGMSSVLLTLLSAGDGQWSHRLMVLTAVRVVGLAVVVLALAWARTVLGSRKVMLAFGLGALSSLALTGINASNPWKFSLSVPVILILLALPGIWGHRWREVVVLLGLTVVSAMNDSRSAAGLLLIASALVLSQRSMTRGRRRRGVVLLQLVVVSVGGYFAVQAAILEGLLGDYARQRSVQQIEQSGSVLLGGRPEIGASTALIAEHPLGLGAGTLVSYDNLQLAKEGMARLGYDPNNRYVENYLFGNGYEVHSVLGDLWIWAGLPGLALCVVVLVVLVQGLSDRMASGANRAVVSYLVLRALWDLPFSPFPSAMWTLAPALALSLVPRPGRQASEQGDGVVTVLPDEPLGSQPASPLKRATGRRGLMSTSRTTSPRSLTGMSKR